MNVRPTIPSDRVPLEESLRASHTFYDFEIVIALELFDLSMSGRDPSYRFLTAEIDGAFAGYVCFGEIPITRGSYDLYWLAVHPEFGRRGAARALVEAMMEKIRGLGGRKIYVETSSRVEYKAARSFYLSTDFHLLVTYSDFYAPGDAKIVFERDVELQRIDTAPQAADQRLL